MILCALPLLVLRAREPARQNQPRRDSGGYDFIIESIDIVLGEVDR